MPRAEKGFAASHVIDCQKEFTVPRGMTDRAYSVCQAFGQECRDGMLPEPFAE